MLNSKCENCGNIYDKSFSIIMDNERYVFDSFECAINKLAPRCAHCNTRIIGHGVEDDGQIFCCANCARHIGKSNLTDRAENRPTS